MAKRERIVLQPLPLENVRHNVAKNREIKRLRAALEEIAGYEGPDSEFDYTAAQMRQTARDALKPVK